MTKHEPIETRKTIKFYEREQIYSCTVEFRKLLFDLLEAEALPCEIEIECVFFKGGCPTS